MSHPASILVSTMPKETRMQLVHIVHLAGFAVAP